MFNNNKIMTNKKMRDDVSMFYNDKEAVLRLGKASSDIQGSYTCKAVNEAGAATSTCLLSIKEAPKPAAAAATLPEKSKPAFYVPLKNQAR